MAQQESRRFAAIMFTDMVGYSALAHKDEALAQELLEEHRSIVRPLIEKHNGKEVKTTGDGFLVEFSRPVEAVRCAIEVQGSLQTHNSIAKQDRQIHLRIGIHFGEVEEAEGDIYGDGVNIAARIESLAETDGICISDAVFSQVRNKINMPLVTIGKPELKNIEAPIEIYKVRLPTLAGDDSAEPEIEDSFAGEAKSIAVLPFENMSPDAANEYFSDGMTEELINALAKIQGLRVPARTSSFAFKNQNIDIRMIGEQLNVNTVLEGSVRKSGDKLRITAQLIDVANGYHLWSENFDRELDDIFVIQDEIARSIVEALKVELELGVNETLIKRYTDNLDAYTFYLQGRYHYYQRATGSGESAHEAVAFFERAIQLEPDYALAYTGLADAYSYLAVHGGMARDEGAPQARKCIEKALELDNSIAEAYASRALIKERLDHDLMGAEKDYAKALALNPNNAQIQSEYAVLLSNLGRNEDAIEEVGKALELDPLSAAVRSNAGYVLGRAGHFEEAVKQFEKQLELHPKSTTVRHNLSLITKAYLLDWGKAEKILKDGLEINPDNAYLHLCYAYHLNTLCRYEESIAEAKTALKLNPASIETNYGLGVVLKKARRYDDAIAQFQKAMDIDPNDGTVILELGKAYLCKSLYEKALEAFHKAKQHSSVIFKIPPMIIEAWKGITYAQMGQLENANEILESLLRDPDELDHKSMIALLYFAMGDIDRGFEWLDRASDAHDLWVIGIQIAPLLDSVRADPRYHALLKKIGLPTA